MGCGVDVVVILNIWFQYYNFSNFYNLLNTSLWPVCMVMIMIKLQVCFHFVYMPCCFLYVFVSTLFQEEQPRQAKINREKLCHVVLRQAVVLY